MTETKWLASVDLTEMLIYLRGDVEPASQSPDPRPRCITKHGELVAGEATRVSSRRLARFARECCRKWWDLPLGFASQELLVEYERFLDGLRSWEEFCANCTYIRETVSNDSIISRGAFTWSLTPFGMSSLTQSLAWSTACHIHRERIAELERTASEDELFTWGFFGYDFPEFGATASEIFRPLPGLLREVVGNPFRPVTLDTRRLTSTAIALARQMDKTLDLSVMPILADALQDAGCEDPDVLAHCRGPGPHVRGCWVVDCVLGEN